MFVGMEYQTDGFHLKDDLSNVDELLSNEKLLNQLINGDNGYTLTFC